MIATSATASAVASAVARTPRSKRDDIDRLRVSTAQVRRLYERISVLGLAGRRKVTGIGPRRAEIIVRGDAVLLEFLQEFHLPAYYYSRAGVRDGIIADLAARNVGAELSRLTREQRREAEDLGRRYGVSLEHARKVADLSIFVRRASPAPPAAGAATAGSGGIPAGRGHYVSSVSHHKHSYYVVSNSDMAGFTDRERFLIAAWPLPSQGAAQRLHGIYQALSADERRILLLMIPILRPL